MVLKRVVTDIDSPVFFEAEWLDPDLEFYGCFPGAILVSDVSLDEWTELFRNRNHETCEWILKTHSSRRI